MGSWKGRGNQYIQFVRVLYCKLPTSGKQLSYLTSSREPNPGLRGGRRECYHSATVAPTHQGGVDIAPTPENDVVTLRNEQVVYVPDDNSRNPSREAKYQRDLLKDYFKHTLGDSLSRRTGSDMFQPNTLGAEGAGIYQSFTGLPNYSKKFYLSWCCSNFQQISKENPFPPSFKTISKQITSPLRL